LPRASKLSARFLTTLLLLDVWLATLPYHRLLPRQSCGQIVFATLADRRFCRVAPGYRRA
jgi:hypothetical protein